MVDFSFLKPCTLNTFDTLVETGTYLSFDESGFKAIPITKEMSKEIEQLGYYGKILTEENIENLKKGIAWKSKPYGVMAHLCDGPLEMWFDTLEEAKEYVVPRVEYVRGPTSFSTDFGTWELVGFTLKDVGVEKVVEL